MLILERIISSISFQLLSISSNTLIFVSVSKIFFSEFTQLKAEVANLISKSGLLGTSYTIWWRALFTISFIFFGVLTLLIFLKILEIFLYDHFSSPKLKSLMLEVLSDVSLSSFFESLRNPPNLSLVVTF